MDSMMAKGGSESKRLKRKREDNLWEEKLPKGWFWVWWPDSGWWKVRITEIEEEEEWYWPGTQEPLDTPILPLTIAYDSDKNGSTCFIERVLWHEGVLYDQEGEETISYCLSPPKDYVADNREQSPSNVSSPSSSSSSAGSSETGARLREKVFSERNKETKLHVNPKTKKVGTSPRKDTELQQRVAENMREKAKNILKQTLLENVEEANVEVDEAHIENIAVDIEKALYEKYAKADYLAQLRSITFNLRGKRNLELKRAIVVSEISPTRIAEMTADELASKSMREERKRREQESFARAVIRDPTDVGIVKGMNSTEVSHKGREDSYESEKAVTKDALLQAREEEVGEEEETGVSTLEAPSPVSGAAVSDAQVTPKELPTRETYEQNDSVEAQQSSNLTLGNVEFPFSSGLDDKFQQFATSVGEPEADRPSRSVLRGSTTNAVRSKRRTAVWQGNISFDETKSFHAMAFYLIGANNYTVLPQQLNVIGRTELGSTIEFVKGLEQSTSREFSILYFKPRDSGDESGFRELIDFLCRRKRAAVLFQTGHSEAYILPPGKLTSHIHDYGRERVLGVIVTRKTHLQEPSVSVSKQVNIAERESFSQSFHTSSVEEEKNVTSPRNSSQAQLSTKVAQEAPIASDAEKGLEGSFAVFKGNISANMSSGPEKGLLNSNFTERQQNILPGLPSRPPLSVLGHRSLPGIPGLNKTNETNKESSQK